MKRMDRLFAILMALQQRQETAQSLADKFEVSKRTILRDMQLLSEIGIPLYALTGPSGGFRIMEGFHLAPLQLNSREVLTILFALQSMTQLQETPFNPERWTVLDKIRKILPEDAVRQIEPLLSKMEIAVPRRHYTAPHLTELLTYTSEARWLNVFYRSEHNRRWLLIKPNRVFTAGGFWYCEAYSKVHGEDRTFRVDRMDTIEVMDAGVMPDEQQDRGPQVPKVKPLQEDEPVRIRAKLTYRGMLRAERDEHIGESIRAISDEEWEVDFMCPPSEWEWFVRFFYSLGMEAEVIEPDALRAEIHQIAQQMCVRYNTHREADKE